MSGRDKIPILMYHEIYGPDEQGDLRGLTNPAYNTEWSRFRSQMGWVRSAGIRTLTIDELVSDFVLPREKTICLTFDDGWLGNYTNAYPILRGYGFKATFFVAADLIGKPYYVTWNQLKEMQSSGMSIQSHTVTHRALGDMAESDVRFELEESKRIIEERLNSEVNHLSLPHGSRSLLTWQIAREFGYKTICTSDVGFRTRDSKSPWLKRICIGDRISGEKFSLIARGKSRAIWMMKASKDLKNTLRWTIGSDHYRRFYQWVYGVKA